VEVPVAQGIGSLWPDDAGDPGATVERARGGLHRVREMPVDLAGYAETGLQRRTMGRDLDEDPLFFAAPLAAGAALAAAA
jgi:hypothetical protein